MIAAFVLLVVFYRTSNAQSGGADFTIIVLPDPQYYPPKYPQIFDSQTQWIANNIGNLNIKMVLDVGDTVNGGGSTTEWQRASSSMSKLEGKVPYFAAIGNHDYNADNPQSRTSAATNFNHYFGPSRYANSYSGWLGSYPSGSNENFYGAVTINGKRFLVVALEFYPRPASLAWAANIIAQNPDAEVIILTHSYEYFDNSRVTLCDNYNAEYYGMGADNDGEEMWMNLVSRYGNISMVFSGHIVKSSGLMASGHQTEAGVKGNIVNSLLSDGQAMTNGGNGYLRIVKVSPANNRITVTTYSPYLNAYLTDSANSFSVPWHATSSSGTGTIAGKVRNKSCAAISGAKVAYSGGSTTTSSSGSFTFSNVPAGMQTLTVTASGYPTVTRSVPVGSGLTSSAQIFPGASLTPGPGPGPAPSPTPTPTPTPPPGGTPTPSPTPTPSGGTGAISGKITNISTSAALSGVTVSTSGRSTTSDSAGNYSLAALSPGTYTVTATRSGWGSQSKNASVAAGGNTILNFAMATSGIISGTVKNSSGAGVAGASVTFKGGVLGISKTVTTSSTGSYSSSWIPIGSYTVTVSLSGHTTQNKTAAVNTGAITTLNFTSF
jgi:hypothetical protein